MCEYLITFTLRGFKAAILRVSFSLADFILALKFLSPVKCVVMAMKAINNSSDRIKRLTNLSL